MPAQIVERPFGGRDDLDVETLEQRTRAVVVPLQLFGDCIVEAVGVFRRQQIVQPEQIGKDVIEPQPRRRAAKQIVVFGEQVPDFPTVRLDRRAVQRRHAEILQPHALREQHPEYVMIRHDQQLRRIGERFVERVPARVGMAMRTDDRQPLHALIEGAGDRTHSVLGGEQAIRMRQCAHKASNSSRALSVGTR